MSTFWKIAKAGAVMFTVGILLAAAAPLIAGALGEGLLGTAAFTHAMATPVLWTGAFFGAFGAIHAAVAPLVDRLDGTAQRTEAAQAKIDAHINAPSREPGLGPELEVVTNYHRQNEEARRAAVAATSAQI